MLQAGREAFAAFVGPYSVSCDATALLVDATGLDDLERKDIRGKLLLIHGDLAKEQIMPKGFEWYNPDEHRRTVALLEQVQPAAIIAATAKNPGLAGALYPFPMFEDGDFDIPSVYMTDVEGDRLLAHVGRPAHLAFESRRIPSTGYNIVARKPGDSEARLVFCAHIDTKIDTPGALDNGSGVAVLLALAGLLQGYSGKPTVEIVAINGEDTWSHPGETLYFDANQSRLRENALEVNLDAPGFTGVRTAFSFYECPGDLAAQIRAVFAGRDNFVEGEPWPQSDHTIFAMNGVPAMAITSENLEQIAAEFAHTEKDRVELLDSGMLADIAFALRDVVLSFH